MTAKIIKGLGVAAALGMAVMPLAAFAATDSKEAEVTVTINPSIALALDNTKGNATLNANESTAATGHAYKDNFYTVAKVSTNAAAGYTVSVKDKEADASLILNSDNKIPAAAGEPAAATATWAVKDSTGAWVAMPASTATNGVITKTVSALSVPVSGAIAEGQANSGQSKIEYAVSSGDHTVLSGAYSTTVVVTATTN